MIKRIIKDGSKAEAQQNIERDKPKFADLHRIPYTKPEYKGKKSFNKAQDTDLSYKVFITFPIGVFFFKIELRSSDEWRLFSKVSFKYGYGVMYAQSH